MSTDYEKLKQDDTDKSTKLQDLMYVKNSTERNLTRKLEQKFIKNYFVQF